MTTIATGTAGVPDPPQLVPPIAIKPDRNRPIIILVSLLLHVAILLPLLLPKETAPPQPQEIPVELVHEQPPAPKPPPQKQEAAKPPPKPQEQKPPEQKPQEKAKSPEPQKSQDKKPDPPKQEKKPDPSKTSEEKTSPDTTTERMNKLLGEDTPPIDNAIAMPGASIDGTDGVSYRQLVMSRIAKAKRDILIVGRPGSSVVVAFTLSDTGAVANVSITSPSGSPDLDKEALTMVGRGEPYPPPPPGAKRDFSFGLTMRSGP